MILGVFNRIKNKPVDSDKLRAAISSANTIDDIKVCCQKSIGLIYRSPYKTPGYTSTKPLISLEAGVAVLFSGMIYNRPELFELLDRRQALEKDSNQTELILRLYLKFGIDFLEKLNGKFSLAVYDLNQRKLFVARDRFGIEPLYYYSDAEQVVVATTIKDVFRCTRCTQEINVTALGKYLLFNYNPSLETFFKDIYRLRPAHLLVADDDTLTIRPYWRLSFKPLSGMTEDQICGQLLTHLKNAVRIRMEERLPPGIFLSGGMDSSTILALASKFSSNGLKTFSYRCQSESFDEAYYARRMSSFIGSEHHEDQYRETDIFKMPEIVKNMNEPFCDAGINIASFILGRKAASKTNYVFTGDGGDELFGGHPVYEADKIAYYFERLPNPLTSPLVKFLAGLPDSDKKKNAIVKLKRFSENIGLPAELLSHRWRVYYRMDEIRQIFSPSAYDILRRTDLYEDILSYNREADGEDLLSRSLYSDYQTAVDFYLRRNDLNRAFMVETRYPMLDHHLAGFCFSIPSNKKIKGWFDTKYILKKTMENILPADIVYRKDKLGHSIPLKNWIRENMQVRSFIFDNISAAVIKKRGYFNQGYVDRLIAEHNTKRRNNSHRLWALAVLEMWFREHIDK